MNKNPSNVLRFPNGCAPDSNGAAIRSEGNVVIPRLVTRLDVPVDRILTGALDKLSAAVVLGYDFDGGFFLASSLADGGDVLWLLEKGKRELLDVCADTE